MVISPEEVSLPEELKEKTLAEINNLLANGMSSANIPISDDLLKWLTEVFEDSDWKIISREYQKVIKLRFIKKQSNGVPIIRNERVGGDD